MKKMLANIATGLLLVGLTGIAQAEGYSAQTAEYNAREDCCTEGPAYNRDFKQGPVVSTVVLDVGHPYIEGMGFAPSPKGVKTVVPKISGKRDWCCDDMSKAEEDMHFNKANRIEPASGN